MDVMDELELESNARTLEALTSALKDLVGITMTEQARRDVGDSIDLMARRVHEKVREYVGAPPLPPQEAGDG